MRSNVTQINVTLPASPINCTAVIKPANSSFADNWENIPETLVLNGSIGVALFLIFVILTWIAWRRSDSTDTLRTQNIITFLYGYRDPEQWYVIPRLEFLRREDRHHKHDLLYPYIYVPPKLPLANPLELIAGNNQDKDGTKSVESGTAPATNESQLVLRAKTDSGVGIGRFDHDRIGPRKSLQIKSLNVHTQKSLDSFQSDPLSRQRTPSEPQSASSLSQMTSSETTYEPHKSIAPSSGGNFYPSILTAEQLQASSLSRKLNKFFGVFFRVSDEDLIYARGIDAYEYLLFQRHLILVMFVATILCTCVILPIHWMTSPNSNLPQPPSFQRTTIKSIAHKANLHWAHIICSSVIVFTALKVMSSYRESIITQQEPQISRRTLLIGNIPSEQRTRVKLTQIFRDHFPRMTIEAIQFVYDCKSLMDDEMYLSTNIAAKEYCHAYKRKTNSDIYVHKTDVNEGRVCDGYCRLCSFIYVCCCYWPCESKELGTTYYAKEEERYRKKIAATCEKVVREPTEYAFVTFKSYRQARRVIADLASMKQDALDNKNRSQRSVSQKSNRSLMNLERRKTAEQQRKNRSDADKTSEHDELNGGRDKPAGRMLRPSSKYIETSSNDSDPLDPKNNPHVRSIRSPVKNRPKTSLTSVQAAEMNAKSPSQSSQFSKSSRETAAKSSAPQSTGSNNESLTTNPKLSTTDLNEGPLRWSVRYAPHPDNVEFDDLLSYARTSRWTIMLLNALMIIIFVFITTPNVLLSMLERISVLQPDKAKEMTGFEKMTINYVSILLQVITTAILPALITLISRQIPYEDSSTKGHSVMWKVYAFLVLMVIVMPSIGMTSAQAWFERPGMTIDYNCLFPTDNGAYYINYVLSSIFLSTILELIKPVDIVYYYFIKWTSRSGAEIEGGRQFIEREFSVGMQHTEVLLIFAVVMTYSMSCPLIAPVGLFYLCVKHAVDHYNLYYSYFTRKVDKDMQSTIVMFVKVALLLMLFQTTAAISINFRDTYLNYLSLVSQMIFWITLATLGFNCFFDCTARTLTNTKHNRYNHEFCACFYLPKVIASLLRLDAIPSSCISRKV